MSFFEKKYAQHITAIIVFLITCFIYFYPVLKGKILNQDDINRGLATAQEIIDYREKGEEILWTNSEFGGMPTFQIHQIYPNNLLSYIEGGLKLNLPSQIGLIFIIALGFYFLLTTFKVDYRLSIIGALAIAFSTFFILSFVAGHNSKLRAIGYIAPLIAGIIMTFKGKRLLGAAVTCLSLGLSIFANHFQITYYTAILIIVIGIVYLIDAFRNKTLPTFFTSVIYLVIAASIAIGPNISKLWTTYAYAKETMRGGSSELTKPETEKKSTGLELDYAMSWSYGVMESCNLLIPGFYGGSSGEALSTSSETYNALINNGVPKSQAKKAIKQLPMYWGDQPFTTGPIYMGAIIIFLFILGLFIVKGPTKWWILSATILTLMLAWGRHFLLFNEFMFDYFPMYNKFRAPSMILSLACVTMPLMAILALNKLLKPDAIKEHWKKIQLSFYIVGGFCLLVVLLGGSLGSFEGSSDASLRANNWPVDSIIEDRMSMMRNSALTSLALIAAAFGLIWGYSKQKLSQTLFIVAIGTLIVGDLWVVDKKYLNDDHFAREKKNRSEQALTQADNIILQDKSLNYRVVNFAGSPFTDAFTSYYHKNIGGYSAAKLVRYQDLIDHHLSKNNMKVYSMLNTKYFIVQNPQTKALIPQQNPDALGNAWFVNKVTWAENADKEIAALNDFDPNNEVVIDERYKSYFGENTVSSNNNSLISLTSYKPNHLTYKANVNTSTAFTVFSEIYYEGSGNDWQAYIDGKEADHIRVNYTLRGMSLPKGEHTIEFKFHPPSYFQGEKISLILSIVMILLLAAAAFFEFKNSRKKEITTTK